MKALTIRQPYASLIIMGRKRIETRSWSTNYRGPLAIHAGAAVTGRRGSRRKYGPYEVEKDESGLLLRSDSLSWPYRMPLGCVIGVVDLVDVHPTGEQPEWPERVLGNHKPGNFAWVLSAPTRIKPVTYSGQQGFWEFPDTLIDYQGRKAS